MDLKLITEVADLKGQTVLVRASCNVPLDGEEVRNAYRLKRALPTLQYLRSAGAKTIIVSHLGRQADETLYPVYQALNKLLPITWGGVITESNFMALKDSMSDGDIIFCENLRQDAREEANDPTLSTYLASLADLYVNDAFAEAHREHASTFGVAKLLPAYAGLTLNEEVQNLGRVMQPQAPALFMLGGAKFETKLPLVSKYLELYDQVFIGGALANDILKARGYEVGQSLVSDVSLAEADFLHHPRLLLPVDLVVEGPAGRRVCQLDEVKEDEKIFDFGEATVELLKPLISQSAMILWNGPFGNYEFGYVKGTEDVAQLVAKAPGFSVVGGGDTVAAIEKLGLNDQFGFVSIGGGSMLTLLEQGTTPVLDLLRG